MCKLLDMHKKYFHLGLGKYVLGLLYIDFFVAFSKDISSKYHRTETKPYII